MRKSGALVVAGLVIFGLTGLTTVASAAATSLYLVGNGAPSASLSLQIPPAGAPATVVLEPSGAGAAETNPSRYQQWVYDMSGMTASVNTLTIWARPADPDGERPAAFEAYVMDCAQSCTVLKANSKTLPAGTQTWTSVNLPVKTGPTQFGNGHSLVVKVTVLSSSADDVAFAFGAQEFASVLHLSALSVTTTTTTTLPPTTTTTTPPTTTTTVPPTTTTTTPPTTTTTAPPTPSTTTPKSTTSTSATTTSTTVPGTTTTTEPEEELLVGGPPGSPPTSAAANLDFGEARPEMVTLSDSIGMPPDDETSTSATRRAGLRPAEGLGVVFSSVSETFSLYWEIAVALGLLMSTLLMVGFANLEVPRTTADTSERIRRIR